MILSKRRLLPYKETEGNGVMALRRPEKKLEFAIGESRTNLGQQKSIPLVRTLPTRINPYLGKRINLWVSENPRKRTDCNQKKDRH